MIDACRKIEAVKEIRKEARFAAVQKAIDWSYRAKCRAAFDESISRSEQGIIKLFSCALDEAAGETPEGGYFTKGMIDGAEEWADGRNKGSSAVLSLWQAFQFAELEVQVRMPQQHPQYDGGRRLGHFPFAVKP
jgi:hypothetical protein